MLYRPNSGEISGIFGGAFDPPHIGHLILADEALKKLSLKNVIFVPSGEPALKPPTGASRQSRLRLATLAAVSNDRFSVSDYEIKKEGTSYTVDTLKYFSEKQNGRIVFLMGADCISDIKKWKNWEEILNSYMVAVWHRPGFDISGIGQEIKDRVTFIDSSRIPVSSSEIRKRIRSGGAYRYMLPEKVYFYIDSMGLYE